MEFHPALYTASIASGSNGNCYYIGNDQEAVLVDVGISCRELERRMARMGLNMDRVKAIFVSHEHTDHIRGLTVVANKYQLPVFLTPKTRAACRLAIPDRLLHLLRPGYDVHVGALEVTPFTKLHDAADPQSFVIREAEVSVGVFTDVGRVCENIIHYFSQCDVAFLETNYDEALLDQGRYPYFLKNRIRGGRGHLSNREALELFERHRSPKLRLLFFSHLSRDNNHPELVKTLFQQHAGSVRMVIAGRDKETAVYRMRLPETNVLTFEEKTVSYLDGLITVYESCSIRWRLQSV